MGFVPPLNLGGFQPSPATLAQWVYQIWQYLQENPIATEEQLKEYIGTFITTSPETQAMIGEGVEHYLTENPPTAPVQSVQGKTGAVQLAYNEIVPASNAVPVYKASSTPATNTLVGQYNLGYRLFVNTTTQEIFTISPAGALSLVGRGKIDGTTIDLDSTQGDTTIAEAIEEIRSVGSDGYFKAGDGTLICWGSIVLTSIPTQSAYGAGYESDKIESNIRFPTAFITPPNITLRLHTDPITFLEDKVSSQVTGIGGWFYLYAPVTHDSVSGNLDYIAVGRWK